MVNLSPPATFLHWQPFSIVNLFPLSTFFHAQPLFFFIMSSATSPTLEKYITSLAGRYTTLKDDRTISGVTTSRKFNSYVYTRKLLIRKTLDDDLTHHKIYCTHCMTGIWQVDAKSTNSSLQLRHIRHRHSLLPTSQEEENRRLEQLQLDQQVMTANSPFTLARQSAVVSTRKQLDLFDNQTLREHISCFIVSTNASLSVVENPSFQQLLSYCNPSAKMISRRSASRDIQNLYVKLRPRIQAMLQEFTIMQKGRVSLTLDACTSSTQIPFLGVTCHYIEPITWKFQTLLLGFERLHGSHSAEALGEVIITLMNKFHIASSIHCITADSASVNLAMFKSLEKGGLLSEFTAQDCHVRCMGHVVNLAVQTLLNVLRATAHTNEAQLVDEDRAEVDIESDDIQFYNASYKARKIIAKVRASNRLWESLQAQSLAARIPLKRLILDMPVRWNSTHAMLVRLLELRPAIDAICR